MENIMELFERLEDMIEDAAKVPFTDNAMINRTELMDLLMDIRLKFPNALKQAEWVVENRNKILNDAKKEADAKLEESERFATKLVDENEITQKAYEEAQKILDNAKQTERNMKLGAIEYADNILLRIEQTLKDSMEKSHESFLAAENLYSASLQMVTKNRQELRGINKNNIDSI